MTRTCRRPWGSSTTTTQQPQAAPQVVYPLQQPGAAVQSPAQSPRRRPRPRRRSRAFGRSPCRHRPTGAWSRRPAPHPQSQRQWPFSGRRRKRRQRRAAAAQRQWPFSGRRRKRRQRRAAAAVPSAPHRCRSDSNRCWSDSSPCWLVGLNRIESLLV